MNFMWARRVSPLPTLRYLEECLPKSEYWDVPVEQQTEDVTAKRVMEFLGKTDR